VIRGAPCTASARTVPACVCGAGTGATARWRAARPSAPVTGSAGTPYYILIAILKPDVNIYIPPPHTAFSIFTTRAVFLSLISVVLHDLYSINISIVPPPNRHGVTPPPPPWKARKGYFSDTGTITTLFRKAYQVITFFGIN
jgi:hypothetical protein